VDRSPAGPAPPDHERAERLTRAWIAQLVERTPLSDLGALPLSRIGAEAPALIETIAAALSDPDRGPAELARAADNLEALFAQGEARTRTKTRTPGGEAEDVAGVVRTPGGEAEDVAGLESCLTSLLAEQRRYGHPFSLALVDVDGLARINDAYGREAGDRMIAAVGAILKRELREVDFVFRLEDDEFAVMAPHTDPEHLVPMATRVANLIASSQSPDGPRIAIAAGVVGCPGDGLSAERLLESATEAIYAAKAAGAAVARSPDGSETVLQDS
jgi:diguanylate cyclase (GGDEF)-like protein